MDALPGLETFVVLARLGSISRAAQALGVPRSTVSRRLTQLEQATGQTLVERSPRATRLTPAGRALAEQAEPLVAALRALAADARQLDGRPRGTLRVASHPGLGAAFLGEFVAALRQRWPELGLDHRVREHPPSLLVEDFDVVLCEAPPPDAPWLVHRLGPADRIVVASPAWLEAHGQPTLDALPSLPCLGLSSPADRPDAWPLRAGGSVPIAPVLASNDLQTLREATLAGVGLALLPAYAIGHDLLAGTLTAHLPQVGAEGWLVALTSRSRRASPKVGAFLDLVDDFAARYALPPGGASSTSRTRRSSTAGE
ncbi:MAG: LysR family transcriptional regulator [Myxococcota bacterium]